MAAFGSVSFGAAANYNPNKDMEVPSPRESRHPAAEPPPHQLPPPAAAHLLHSPPLSAQRPTA
jgi:hypothetical protein